MAQHAVISGAGIGGPALARQLAANGWDTTVIERYPDRRDEGQNVDIRGAAREVVRRMGIDADVRAANTTEVGMRFLRADGSTAASFPVSPGTDGPTAELEILRGELSRILIEHADSTDFRFGTQIADVVDHGEHVAVTLDDGDALDADLVVIAEGLHSRSRRFVAATEVNDLGMYIAYATIPRRDDDDNWWSWQHATESRSVHLRPDNLGTTRAMLSFVSDVRGLDELGREDLNTILRRTFDDLGGATPRILDELDAGAPMYFSSVGQMSSPAWSTGRVALLGDAAHCNATFGGAGTSLALIGAYVLAGELGSGDDVLGALARYERLMKPFIDAAPLIRPRMLQLMNPRTRSGIRVLHAAAGVVAGPIGRALSSAASAAGKLPINLSAGDPELPTYL
ncbi:FAD-dependent oxidoreductase [Mycobacterium sp. Root265]|uniref:FAD-dependent monooxygenase n=1 Tax=Mycobacterium sp. Root265 TaxID=1736504 RepID=UPI00070BAC91|nr:FAD-dependent monooxygenase [Mycobacterium sp. Root265]KRD09626.1 FAD-dependent oxidoreductase [Mycobacterium sp. Root265]